MNYLTKGLMILAILIIVVVIIACLIRHRFQSKSQKDKLILLDKKFNNDSKIYNGGLYIKNLKTEKFHIVNKGNFIDKRFYLDSVSKLFTHTIIFQVIDENIISPDDTLEHLLERKEWSGISKLKGKDLSGKITVRQLLNQTSGLADYETDFKPDGRNILEALVEKDFEMNFESAVDATRTLSPIHKPGDQEDAYYSNLNALILGRIAEVKLSKSLATIFNEKIFLPLNLKSTCIPKKTSDIHPIYIDSIARSPIKYVSSAPASGGVISTLKDLMTFTEEFFGGRLFDKSHLSAYDYKNLQFFPIKYGNGMMEVKMSRLLSPIYDAPQILGHSGSTGSFAFFEPEHDIIIVGTINQLKSSPFQYIYGYVNALM